MNPLEMSRNAAGLDARLKDRVRVERNSNVEGIRSDDEGVVSPAWTAVPGLSSVRCLIYERPSQRAPGQEQTEDLTLATILFGITPTLPRGELLKFVHIDPDTGAEIETYYAHGKITRPADAYQRVVARIGALED